MVLGGNGSVEGRAVWHFVVLCQYGAVLFGTLWYLVSITWYYLVLSVSLCIKCKGPSCLYILKKSGDLVGCYHSGTTNKRTNKERYSYSANMDHGRLRGAIIYISSLCSDANLNL